MAPRPLNGWKKSLINGMVKSRWFLLVTGLLVYLLLSGYQPAEIVAWAKSLIQDLMP